MKTILISGLVSASNSSSVTSNTNELGSMLEHMFANIDTDLQTCYDIIPEHGHVLDNTCKEEDDTLTCKFKCDENENLHLLKNIVVSGYEVSCRCHQVIDGKRYRVPCAWSDTPQCNSVPPSVIPEYGSHCGALSDENGAWECSGSSCHLTCNNGYVPSDEEAQMSPRCTCNKFGDCNWFKPATCVQVNHSNGQCEAEEPPIGLSDCTGSSMGDLCVLQCPAQFKAEQFGVRRCECNSSGACDWLGDRGRCEEDIQLPPALAALADNSQFGSLLSPANCKTLPTTDFGFWRCDEAQTCHLVCPPGFEANQELEISCLCANGSCTFQNQQSLEHRFQLTDIESINNFECMALIDEYDSPDSVIMEKGIDRCADLPRIENGAWNCTHGTCNLRCLDELDTERIVVDCLVDDTELVDWSQVNCNSQSPKKTRAHANLAQRNLAPLR